MTKHSTTITLTGSDAERLARIVKQGGYTTPEAAISEALATLDEEPWPELDTWLREVVAERLKNPDPNPIPLAEARRRLLGAD
jgi:hypothetical protein